MTLCLQSVGACYQGAEVFTNVSFELGPGQVLGLIGPNGAGKTTLLRIVAGLIRPHSGRITRHCQVLYFGGEATLPGGCRAHRWSALLDAPTPHRKILRRLSRGTRQMVGLSAWLTREDWMLGLLDEPWEGLDPRGARWLQTEIERHRARGASLIVSSHRLHDVSAVCTAYGFLARGSFRSLTATAESASGGRPDAADLIRVFDETAG
ncbi:MAG: ATP-binding cassette domain-containing protein [Acidobacteriota bacterium]|nr:ATP-binding cassette domain-containing protein [Acidobacteriota bacterium]